MFDRQDGPITRTGFKFWAPDQTQLGGCAQAQGVIPSSRVAYSVNPSNNDTLGIGTPAIKFVTSLGAQITQTQVKVLGSAALSLAAVLNAINGVTDANVVPGSVPIAASVVADAVTATVLRLRNATVRGGVAKAGISPTLALAASITGGASAWTTDNLNLSGKSPADVNESCGSMILSAAQITGMGAGGVAIELPFAPTVYSFQFVDSTGKGLNTITDTVTISGNALVLTTAGTTHLVATNVIEFWASA
jgi:hypothetical protein